MSVKISYVYKDVSYTSAYQVRQAVFKHDRVAFGPAPTEESEKAEFWKQFGVEYKVEEVVIPLSTKKDQKLRELEQQFEQWYTKDATLKSSLGFRIDCDQRAKMDVDGLVQLGEPAVFMDAENQPHEVTVEDLQTMQKEIIKAGNAAYAEKWAFRTAIEAAETEEALNEVSIYFAVQVFEREVIEEITEPDVGTEVDTPAELPEDKEENPVVTESEVKVDVEEPKLAE